MPTRRTGRTAAGWEKTPLKRFQATDDTKQALDRLSVPEQNEILKSIARQIKEAALSSTDRSRASQCMSNRRKYLKRATEFVIAVQVNLDMEGFTYQKWGGTQRCKRGDWLVDNNGDVYTVDGNTFTRTYRSSGPGTYVKATPVWAEVAGTAGAIRTAPRKASRIIAPVTSSSITSLMEATDMRSRESSSTGCMSLSIEEEALCAYNPHGSGARRCSLRVTDSWWEGLLSTGIR